MKNEPNSKSANSLGHQLSHAAHLDGHFAHCQTEYEAMVRSVGIQNGWHVLDAGCGAGSFLPLLASLVGSNGQVTAIDVASENVELAKELVETLQLEDSVVIQEGELTQLKFNDDMFDAVWCANVTQYLRDEEFSAALEEMLRVTKPGGRIGIKEFDITSWQYQPSAPHLVNRLFWSHEEEISVQTNGTLRPLQFRSWCHQAGLENIQLKSFVSETQPPLNPRDKEYMHGLLSWLSNVALDADIPESDKEIWRELGSKDADDHILNRPDFYARETHILAVGTKPA